MEGPPKSILGPFFFPAFFLPFLAQFPIRTTALTRWQPFPRDKLLGLNKAIRPREGTVRF